MKKVLAAITPAITLLTLAPSAFAAPAAVPSAAVISTCATGQFSALCGFSVYSFGNIVGGIISLMFVIAVVAALFYLVWGGLKWLMSGGDKQAVASAREHIVAAVIGLVIVFLSYFIMNILIGFFIPGFTLSTLTLPKIVP